MSAYTNPTVTDFKDYFFRDFPYGATQATVMDADITKAMAMAASFINPAFFCSQGNYQIGFLLLSAHFLVMNLRMSAQGLAGQYAWLPASKSVGSVAASYSIPQRILDNPELAWLCQTNYGAMYLALVLPGLSGQIYVVAGRTLP